MVLFARASADADGADDFARALERDAAGEDHDFTIVGGVDAEELVAGLAVFGKVFGGDIEGAGGPGFFDGDVDAAEPCSVHADVSDEVAAFVGYGDVHGLSDFGGFAFAGGDDGAGFIKSHEISLPHRCGVSEGWRVVIVLGIDLRAVL